MKCGKCNAVFCQHRTTNAEQECVFNYPQGMSDNMDYIPDERQSLHEISLALRIIANCLTVQTFGETFSEDKD